MRNRGGSTDLPKVSQRASCRVKNATQVFWFPVLCPIHWLPCLQCDTISQVVGPGKAALYHSYKTALKLAQVDSWRFSWYQSVPMWHRARLANSTSILGIILSIGRCLGGVRGRGSARAPTTLLIIDGHNGPSAFTIMSKLEQSQDCSNLSRKQLILSRHGDRYCKCIIEPCLSPTSHVLH